MTYSLTYSYTETTPYAHTLASPEIVSLDRVPPDLAPISHLSLVVTAPTHYTCVTATHPLVLLWCTLTLPTNAGAQP